jgi:hypothetical protein
MKVFISWSGARSKAIATAFHEWLPLVIQAIDPWMSSIDIGKGTKWDPEIATQLGEINFGLICLTPENRNSTAIHFEAGAISKSLNGGSRVYTFLHQMEHTDVNWPLSQFQHTKSEKEDIRKLLHSMHQVLNEGEKRLNETKLNHIFDTMWLQLQEKLAAIPLAEEIIPERSEKDMIKEILETVRFQDTTRELSWIFDRLKGPQAILYETVDGERFTFEEAIDKFGTNRYVVNPFRMSDGFIIVNTTLGVARFTKDLAQTYRKPSDSLEGPSIVGNDDVK